MLALSRWFAAEPRGDRLVAFGREGERSDADLRRDVASLAARIAPARGRDLVLHCDDAYAFAVGLLAAARVGARAVLPPSRQPGTLRELAGEVYGALLDTDAPDAVPGRPCWHPLDASGQGPRAASRRRAKAHPVGGQGPRAASRRRAKAHQVSDGAPAELAPLVLDRNAPLAVMFTSGSTGAGRRIDKAVRHLEDEVTALEQKFGALLAPDTRILATVAPQHLYGLLFRVLWPLAAGRPFLRSAVLHPEELAPHAEGASSFAVVSTPATLRHLVERGDLSRRTGCRAVFSSGGPLSAEIARRTAEALGSAPWEVYGSTETGGAAARQQLHGDEPWQPMPGVSVELDAETGCLAITSPFVSADGDRFTTGDRAALSGDGTFQLLGRADRVIKVGERRLSLPDMEERLRAHASVEDVALLALEKGSEASFAQRAEGERRPDGVRVAAVVVPTATAWDAMAAGGRRSLAKTLTEHLAAHFERVLLPRAWRFTSALPRNAQDKVTQDALRELFGADAQPDAPEPIASERDARSLEERVRIPWDLAFLDGHFPGFPVVAGVVQVHFAMRALEQLLGEAPALESLEELKFHAVLTPGQEAILRVELREDGARFRFSLADADDERHLFASGRGRLEARP